MKVITEKWILSFQPRLIPKMESCLCFPQIYVLTGHYDDAISDFALLLQKKPDDIEAHYKMGNAYANIYAFTESVRLYDKVIALDPTHALAVYSRAQAYYCLGAYEKAIGDFNKSPRAEARGFLARRTAIDSAQPASADIAPGDHSSPGLKAVGFSGQSYKCIKLGLYDEYCRLWKLIIMKQMNAEGYIQYADEFKKHLSATKSDEWIRIVSKYLLEVYAVSEADVIAETRKAKTDREIDEQLCEAYLFLAVKHLQKGDTQSAASFLQKSIDTKIYEFYEYVTAGVLLKSIQSVDKKGI